MTHGFSNDPIPRIKLLTLVNALDLENWAVCVDLLSLLKQRHDSTYGGSFNYVSEV